MPELNDEDVESNRLYIAIFYEGPWERAMNWLWYLAPGQTYRDVPEGSLRDRLAQLAEARHHRWVRRYELHPERIPLRWRTRPRT